MQNTLCPNNSRKKRFKKYSKLSVGTIFIHITKYRISLVHLHVTRKFIAFSANFANTKQIQQYVKIELNEICKWSTEFVKYNFWENYQVNISFVWSNWDSKFWKLVLLNTIFNKQNTPNMSKISYVMRVILINKFFAQTLSKAAIPDVNYSGMKVKETVLQRHDGTITLKKYDPIRGRRKERMTSFSFR